MDFAGYIVFGMIFLILGIVLYIPGRLLARRVLKESDPNSDNRLRISSSGLALVFLWIFVLILGTSQEYISPGTKFGKFIGTVLGKLSFWAAVTALTVVFGLILEALGFKLFRHHNGDG